MTGNRRWLALLAAVLIAALAGVAFWLWPDNQAAKDAAIPSPSAPSSSATASTGTGTASASAEPVPSATPASKQRMLLGTYISLSGKSTEAAIEQREAAMGHRYNLQLTYYNWDDQFPDAGESTIVAHGRTPLVTWYGPGKDADDHRTLAEVNDGSDDRWITQQADAIKDFGHRIYLRLMPEMNGNWYHGFSGDPSAYIKAWQHIHRLFAQAGATNVTWVWCPNNGPADWGKYYPGNAYADIIGVDGFSNVGYGYQSFEQMFGQFFSQFAGRRPLMVVETATNAGAGAPAHGIASAASFIDGMHTYLKEVAGPKYGVVAVCWFDTNDTDGIDWSLSQTPASWQAWLSLARDLYFGG
ncbi:MAG TPA: glycosyl hydrolase [Streptosporangiaceae bacterium]